MEARVKIKDLTTILKDKDSHTTQAIDAFVKLYRDLEFTLFTTGLVYLQGYTLFYREDVIVAHDKAKEDLEKLIQELKSNQGGKGLVLLASNIEKTTGQERDSWLLSEQPNPEVQISILLGLSVMQLTDEELVGYSTKIRKAWTEATGSQGFLIDNTLTSQINNSVGLEVDGLGAVSLSKPETFNRATKALMKITQSKVSYQYQNHDCSILEAISI